MFSSSLERAEQTVYGDAGGDTVLNVNVLMPAFSSSVLIAAFEESISSCESRSTRAMTGTMLVMPDRRRRKSRSAGLISTKELSPQVKEATSGSRAYLVISCTEPGPLEIHRCHKVDLQTRLHSYLRRKVI